ncbi:MAG: hypothetical protein GWQ05_16140 [Verrucomicrobiaceae bacterium]|nr:hypothetical protein [Verrucomicrobiaceae bacterium]NCF92464.1 hypothetical protein [Verrucomicrobiaceae bacterium]
MRYSNSWSELVDALGINRRTFYRKRGELSGDDWPDYVRHPITQKPVHDVGAWSQSLGLQSKPGYVATLKELAFQLGCHVNTIRLWRKDPLLRCPKASGRFHDVNAWRKFSRRNHLGAENIGHSSKW